MPIDNDMLFPPIDCQAEQKMIPDSEFRIINSIDGHLALFGTDQGFVTQVDRHLRELLTIKV